MACARPLPVVDGARACLQIGFLGWHRKFLVGGRELRTQIEACDSQARGLLICVHGAMVYGFRRTVIDLKFFTART